MRFETNLLGLQLGVMSSSLCRLNSGLRFQIGSLSLSGDALLLAPHLLKLQLQLLILLSKLRAL